jgi:hypothetical protein
MTHLISWIGITRSLDEITKPLNRIAGSINKITQPLPDPNWKPVEPYWRRHPTLKINPQWLENVTFKDLTYEDLEDKGMREITLRDLADPDDPEWLREARYETLLECLRPNIGTRRSVQ